MLRGLPQDRALLMKLLSDVEAVDGALACLISALNVALEQEAQVRPLDDTLFEQTGYSRLHRRGVTSPVVGSTVAWATQGLSRLPLLWNYLEPEEGEASASECQALSARVEEALSDSCRHAFEALRIEDLVEQRAKVLAARDAVAASLRALVQQCDRVQSTLRGLLGRVTAALEGNRTSRSQIPPGLEEFWPEFTDTERLVLKKIWESRRPEGTPVADLFPLIGWEGKAKADKNLRVHLSNIKKRLGRRNLPPPWERKKGRVRWVGQER